ncbi:carboxypeptidase-like regulatory domain-containing protein [Marinobacter alexandrii]|uniref:carboxypeptidase-like regulatory domain-containing protein n=1 Tax=Marinobacter alexandrii TaxID=2570351 RepID=UPI001FFF467F|nr:carboxypeptidase-like regulatory domain-containing protein [Marinobacter alexandrii]MCK2150786.1 carboxypeptidase-like regulatory domain-containing protein [Marinobacter alexandrii]
MRVLGRAITLLMILLLLWPIGKEYVVVALEWMNDSPASQRPDLPDEADQETVFWLSSERWMRFSLTESASTVRILAHLEMLPDQVEGDSDRLYGFAYRLLDERENEVYSDRHYFRAAVLPPRQLEDGREFPARFYDDPERVASAAENLFFGLGEAPTAVSLELRAIDTPVAENRIGVQISEEQTRPRADAGRMWPRMAPETRKRLLRSHSYPPHLVSPFEIENVLISRWMPLGPEGVDGTDFTSDYLYTLNVPPAPPMDASKVVPSGLSATQSHWVTMPIPEQGRYRLEIEPVDANVRDFTANVAHQGNSELEVQKSQLQGQPPMLVWKGELAPGLLKLNPSVPVAIRLFDDDTGAELTPDARYLRADIVTPGNPVRFMLDPDNDAGQPVRLDLRTFVHPERPDSGLQAAVSVRVTDESGEVLEEYQQGINPPPSYYQRFSGTLAGSRVSEAKSLFLQVAENAAELEVTSNTPLLVTGYARLMGLPLERDLPSERRPWQGYANRMPNWFLMKPMVSPEPGQRVTLQWFFKPIELNPAIASGRYDWEALQPAHNSLIREVLFPHRLSGPLRQSAVGSIYRALPKAPVTLTLVAPEKNISFMPELIYRRSNSSPETVTVFRDGKVWLRRGIAGRTGRFSLPLVDAGRYRIEVEGSGQWYLNHNQPPDGAGYLKRSLYFPESTGQTFVLDKVLAREVANLDVIAPQGVESFTVTVRVSNAVRSEGLLDDFSFLDRRYQIRVKDNEALMLGSQSGAWASPVTIGIPLGEDLPPGRYRISVELNKPGGLMAGYTVREGQSQNYRFFRRSLDGY